MSEIGLPAAWALLPARAHWLIGEHSLGGISRPSAFAVLRLMKKSKLVGCTTGKSPGLAPLRIRAT
jgi:hypothetical protein